MNCQRFGGLFGEELVAGSFLFFFGLVANSFFLIQKKINLFFLTFLIFSLLVFITGDRTPFISIIILVLLNLIFNRHIRLKIFYALLIITIIFTIFANFSKVINQRYISDIKNMLRASELNSISLRFQITEYRKELNRLEREILSNKEKNIDNEKNYKDLQIIKDETDRMLLRLKKS